MKLTKSQQDLADAMRGGVRVLRSSFYPKYWRRLDNDKKCTVAAAGLIAAGVARVSPLREDDDFRFYERELRLLDEARK